MKTNRKHPVKKEIANALIKLMKDKPYSKISISEISENAKVSRISFYRNFKDKDDVIKYYFDGIITPFADKISNVTSLMTVKEFYKAAFTTVEKRKDDFSLFYKNNLLGFFIMELQKACLKAFDKENNPEDYYRCLVFNGSFTLVTFGWLFDNRKETPEELAEIYEKILFSKDNYTAILLKSDLVK